MDFTSRPSTLVKIPNRDLIIFSTPGRLIGDRSKMVVSSWEERCCPIVRLDNLYYTRSKIWGGSILHRTHIGSYNPTKIYLIPFITTKVHAINEYLRSRSLIDIILQPFENSQCVDFVAWHRRV